MQTFLPFLLVWDDSKTVLENLQACFRLMAQLLDNKRTGKQRVEAMQLLNILLGRNPDSSWKRHPVLQMWKPWPEALKLYYNCFLEEWMARGFVNNLPLEPIDEDALNEQGVPPFLSNKHFKYDWGVEPREGYYWYLDGVYVLTKYGKRFESDLSGDQAPPEPERPERKRKPRAQVKKEEIKEEEQEPELEEEEDAKSKRAIKRERGIKQEEAVYDDDDDFMQPRNVKRRNEVVKVKLERAQDDDEDSYKGKEREDADEAEAEEEERAPRQRRRAKRKMISVGELVASFAFPAPASTATAATAAAKRTRRTNNITTADSSTDTAIGGATAAAQDRR